MKTSHKQTADSPWLEAKILWYTSDRAAGHDLTEFDRYGHYATILARILGAIRDQCSPLGMVSVRRKDPGSYADKCVRKFESFQRDPDYGFSDLCGGRIVVSTLSEMQAVHKAVREHFRIVQDDDTRHRLSTAEFGYLSIHFDVEIDPARLPADLRAELAADIAAVNGPDPLGQSKPRRAEIQVRTLLQHVWSDVLHDRLYKTQLELPVVYRRHAASLAARLEELDKDFNQLQQKLDAYQLDYGAYLDAETRKQRVEALRLLIGQERIDPKRRAAFSLESMRLLRANGDWTSIVGIGAEMDDSVACDEARLLAAYAQCRKALAKDGSIADSTLFAKGEAVIQSFTHCPTGFPCQANALSEANACLNCCHRSGLRANALALAAWCVLRRRRGNFHATALHYFRRASNCAPGNPYILRELLVCEAIDRKSNDFVRMMLAHLEQAIALCEEHIAVKTELPNAYFTAGMLLVLLGRDSEGMVRYCQGAIAADDGDVLHLEMEKAGDLAAALPGASPAQSSFRTLHLLLAAILLARSPEQPERDLLLRAIMEHSSGLPQDLLDPALAERPILIVAGGAASLSAETGERLRGHLAAALDGWNGVLISGGTCCGVPGIVGDLLETPGCAGVHAIGLHPGLLPADAPMDSRYHQRLLTQTDKSFSTFDAVATWLLLLRSGVAPSKVKLLGIGGGPIAALEYAMALAMGGQVGLVVGSSGSTVRFLEQRPAWSRERLLGLPEDPATLRAFIFADQEPQENLAFEAAARAAHEAYRAQTMQEPAENLRPWEKLDAKYKVSNYHQVTYARIILATEGLALEPCENPQPVDLEELIGTQAIERMAIAEHGRWNVERLRKGWSFGERDNEKLLHPNIVPWGMLDDKTKDYDRKAVKAFPDVLAAAGFQIVKANPNKKP